VHLLAHLKRLKYEGEPFGFFVQAKSRGLLPWEDRASRPGITLSLSATLALRDVVEATDVYCKKLLLRATAILRGSDSVLILGKDTEDALEQLVCIQGYLSEVGILATIVKQEMDRPEESTIQKVLRYALASEFVILENSSPSGHLYELPHVAKLAECIVAVLQRPAMGATWMFEDAYFRHGHWRKFEYDSESLPAKLMEAVEWAQGFRKAFGDHQSRTLPWLCY
jgi:hypothetical protein